MTVQGRYSDLNGLVTSPYGGVQASNVNYSAVGQNIATQNAIATGEAPLASATTNPIQPQQQVTPTEPTTQAAPVKDAQQVAVNPPAPAGCGANLDCNA